MLLHKKKSLHPYAQHTAYKTEKKQNAIWEMFLFPSMSAMCNLNFLVTGEEHEWWFRKGPNSSSHNFLASLAMAGRPDETEMHWILSLTRMRTTWNTICKMSKPLALQNMALVLHWKRMSCFILMKAVNSKSFLSVINTAQIKTAPGTSLDKWKNLAWMVVFPWHCFRQTKQHNLQLAQKINCRVDKKWLVLLAIQMIDKLFSLSS